MLAAVLMECVPDGSTRHTNQLFLSHLSCPCPSPLSVGNQIDAALTFLLFFYLRMEEVDCLVCCCHVVVVLNTKCWRLWCLFNFPPFRSSWKWRERKQPTNDSHRQRISSRELTSFHMRFAYVNVMSVLYACLLILFRLLYAAGDAHLSCRRCTFSNRNISPRPTRSVWLYYFKSRLVENNSSPGNCIKKNVSILLLLFFIREIAVRWMTFYSSSFPFWLFGRLKSSAERKNGGCAAIAIIDRLCCCALRDSLFAIAASLSLSARC